MALKKYERSDSIQQQGFTPATGLRAQAENWADVGRTAGQVADLAYEQGVKKAKLAGEQEGEKAIWVDPDTNVPQVVGILPEGTRPYAMAYREAAEGRYEAELGLSALTKVAEIGNQYAMNPEGFRNAWSGYMKGITENVPEALRSKADYLLKEAGTKKYYQLQMEDFERTRGEAKVSTFNLIDAFKRSAVDTLRASGLAGGTPEFLNSQIGKAEQLLMDQERRGVISPEEANESLKDFKFSLIRGMVSGETIKMVKEGKAAQVDQFLDEFRQSPSDMVDDVKRNQISDYARGEVSTALAKAKADARAAQEAAKKQVKDAQAVWWAGENYAMEDDQVLRIAQATGDASLISDTQAALAARTTMRQFSLLSPQEQEAALAETMAAPNQTGDTLRLREKMDAIYKQTISAVDSGDTLQVAQKRGLITFDAIDPANPATLQKRAQDVAKIDNLMSAQSNPLVPAEKDRLIRLFDGMDSEGKIALYGSLKEGLGHDLALRAMRQLGQERPAMALAMAISDDAPEVARQVLLGDLAIQADKNILGSGEFYPDTFRDHVGTALQGDDTLRNAVYQASLAIHADIAKRDPRITSKSMAEQNDVFKRSIDMVTGGVVEFNGIKTIVPRRGMSEGDFSSLVESMDYDAFRAAAGGYRLVHLNGKEVTADLIHNRGIMEWAGDGRYILKIDIGDTLNGQTVFLADQNGQIRKDKWGRPIPAELNLKTFAGAN